MFCFTPGQPAGDTKKDRERYTKKEKMFCLSPGQPTGDTKKDKERDTQIEQCSAPFPDTASLRYKERQRDRDTDTKIEK